MPWGGHGVPVEVRVAYVVPHDGIAITEEAVLPICKDRVASFKAPRQVVFVKRSRRVRREKSCVNSSGSVRSENYRRQESH